MAAKKRRIRDRIIDPLEEPVRWANILGRAFIPDRYQHATIEAIHDGHVREWAKAHTEDVEWLATGRGWYLHGPLGSGKSSLAAILLMEALKRCESGLWLPARDAVAVFLDGARIPRYAQMLEALYEADVLVLDDLASETQKLTSIAGGKLEAAVRVIYDRSRTVIVTGNLNWTDFQALYGEVARPLVSVIQRMVQPFAVVNQQWGPQ